MKKWLLRALDVLAFLVIGAAVLSVGAAACFGLWYMARGFFLYLMSYEGRGLAMGLGFAFIFWAAYKWIDGRYARSGSEP